MPKKQETQLEANILKSALDLSVAAMDLTDVWNVPSQITGLTDFAARNTRYLVEEYEQAVNMPEQTDDEIKTKRTAWTRSFWSKIKQSPTFTIESLTNRVCILVWKALVISNHVNTLRRQMGLKPVNFWNEASDLQLLEEKNANRS